MRDRSKTKPVFSDYRLRRQALEQQRRLLLPAFVLLVAISIGFVAFFEINTWESRQTEIAQTAAVSISDDLKRIEDLLALLGAFDPETMAATRRLGPQIFLADQTYLNLLRLDTAGQIRWQENRTAGAALPASLPLAEQSWFLQARREGNFIAEDFSPANGQPALFFSHRGSNGDVLALRTAVELLQDTVLEFNGQGTLNLYIVNRAGQIIAQPQGEDSFLDAISATMFTNAQAAPGNWWTGYYRNHLERVVFGVSYPIPQTEWLVVVETPVARTFEGARISLLLLAGLIGLVGYIVNNRAGNTIERLILHPLYQLEEGALRVGRGDYSQPIESQDPNEIGDIARAFNLMTAQLNEREAALRAARDEAVAANAFKSRLVANVSHDLRTPLGSILGFSEMLGHEMFGAISTRQREAVERIIENALRLNGMVTNLLDQSRLNQGSVVLKSAPFAPADLLLEAHKTLQPAAGEKGLLLTPTLDPALPPTLLGDAQHLGTILLNLGQNAIKYTDAGTVTLRLANLPEGRWQIQVSDTGRGIPTDQQPKIFEAFYQTENAAAQRTGVGLGLSIVQELVKLMQGQIEVASVEGAGSTFTVTLPARLPETKE